MTQKFRSALVDSDPGADHTNPTDLALPKAPSGGLIQGVKTWLHTGQVQGEKNRQLITYEAEKAFEIRRTAIDLTAEQLIGQLIDRHAASLQATQERLQAKHAVGVINLVAGHANATLRQQEAYSDATNALAEQGRQGKSSAANFDRNVNRLAAADKKAAQQIDGFLDEALGLTGKRFSRAYKKLSP